MGKVQFCQRIQLCGSIWKLPNNIEMWMYNWLIFCEIVVLIYIQFIGCDDKELLRLYTMGYRKSGRCNKVTVLKLLVSLGNEPSILGTVENTYQSWIECSLVCCRLAKFHPSYLHLATHSTRFYLNKALNKYNIGKLVHIRCCWRTQEP